MTNPRSDTQEVSWSEVDLDARSLEIDWKLIRISGEGYAAANRD